VIVQVSGPLLSRVTPALLKLFVNTSGRTKAYKNLKCGQTDRCECIAIGQPNFYDINYCNSMHDCTACGHVEKEIISTGNEACTTSANCCHKSLGLYNI